ncbi:hypothetical protein BDW74DRAFT_186235 [Aspergillus multicolor]|uniref:uncharacterized protein n=1 Tax=Aspergillus multicolor TaxID=41759 RepID=UPI003CCC98F3
MPIREKPRTLLTTGFELVEPAELIEEEDLPDYNLNDFYPVVLGEVIQDRYQTISANPTLALRELPFYQHIQPLLKKIPNKKRISDIRRLLDSFQITGPHGTHLALDLVRNVIIEVLEILDSRHTKGDVVHTDVHTGNFLLGTFDNSMFEKLAELELESPVDRKQDSSGRTIYFSRVLRPREGPMLLSDFGEARIGAGPHAGDIMPLGYRAPEVLLCVGWSFPVDTWSVSLTAWDLLGPKRLFTARNDDDDLSDAVHLAQLIAALGPLPPEFLARNPERRALFWKENGEWLGRAPIPWTRTLKSFENQLEGNSKSRFLAFLRRTLAWLPEDRPTAAELLKDPWLTKKDA